MYLELGPIAEDRDLAEDWDVWIEAPVGEACGHASDLGDLDGDGSADASVGCYDATTSGGHGSGAVYVAYGPFPDGDHVDLSTSADAFLTGVAVEDYAGLLLSAAGDLDGDGLRDLLVAAPFTDAIGLDTGTVYVVYGPPADMSLADADASITGDSGNDTFGEGLASGDVDGDGLDDVVACAPQDSSVARLAGAAFVFHGPLSGATDSTHADVAIHATNADGYLGYTIAARDADGDGRGDVLVGAVGDNTAGVGFGAAWYFSSPGDGTYTTADAHALFLGEHTASYTGYGVGIGDLDADGYGELYIGAPWENTGGSRAGAVYVVQPEF
jgi:hypothetical protein